jgi:hypothetical protein
VKIRAVEAFALSCPIPEAEQVSLGIGRTVKRDAVLVKITTAGGQAQTLLLEGKSHVGANHEVGAPGDTTGEKLVTWIKSVAKKRE